MKTIFIYDQCLIAPISFFVKEGNYSHLDNVYINESDNENLIDQLNDILFDAEWEYKIEFLDKFPTEEVEKDTKVIIVGFLP